jgi:hypothetical protein
MIKSFEDFQLGQDKDMKFEDNRISTIDFIQMLMDAEHEMGYDELCVDDELEEGFSHGSKSGDRTFKFVPGKNDTDSTSTRIFNPETKKLDFVEVPLKKSGVTSYNLYRLSDMRASKALKHPTKYSELENRNIDFDSIDKFMKRTSLYIRQLLKKNPIDIITYPQSSSAFNKEMVGYILRGYKDSPGIKCIPDLMTKNIRKVYINYEQAHEVGLTDKDIYQLQQDIEHWKKDADLYELRLKIDDLKDEILYTKANRKQGRPTREFKQKEELLANLQDQAKILRKGRRGKDKTIGSDGRAKNFEIKSLEDSKRRSIEGLFEINPNLNGIQQKLKGKNVVIFDDNISSGATLDDICLELQKYGVKSILPITLAVIPKTVYGHHESLKDELKPKKVNKKEELKNPEPEKVEVTTVEKTIDKIDKETTDLTDDDSLKILWLDDERNPEVYLSKESKSGAYQRNKKFYDDLHTKYKNIKFKWVKNLDEFRDYIETNGLPEFISFDRDLKKGNEIEKGYDYPDGEDCAKWLVKYCKENDLPIPKYFVHSANKNGQKNIPEILDNNVSESFRVMTFSEYIKK